MLVTLGLVALLAAQPAAEVRSPYLDAVRLYGSCLLYTSDAADE